MPLNRSAPRRGKGKTMLAALRRAAGLTQEELARRSDVSVTTIKEIEAGRTGHTLATLQAVATVLGSSPLELIKPEEAAAGAEAGPAPEDLARAIPGVTWDSANGAWLARITVRGKQMMPPTRGHDLKPGAQEQGHHERPHEQPKRTGRASLWESNLERSPSIRRL